MEWYFSRKALGYRIRADQTCPEHPGWSEKLGAWSRRSGWIIPTGFPKWCFKSATIRCAQTGKRPMLWSNGQAGRFREIHSTDG